MKKCNHHSLPLRHRFTALALAWILMTMLTLPVLADGWYCPKCGRHNDYNYCPKDGTKKPSDLETAGSTWEVHVGDSIYFGTYEQDNNTSNGAEPIEWRVLGKEGNRALLISEYALEVRPYNTTCADVTWESCTLRSWLNGEFYNNAFTSAEQSVIIATTVKAHKNPYFNTVPGRDTQDKVFLLSIQELYQYYSSPKAAMCVPTEYAEAQGAWTYLGDTIGDKSACCWWLRSSGTAQDFAVHVNTDGSLRLNGVFVEYSAISVRPALWIDLDPEFFRICDIE